MSEQTVLGTSSGAAWDEVVKRWADSQPKAAQAIGDTNSAMRIQAQEAGTLTAQWTELQNTIGGKLGSNSGPANFLGAAVQGIDEFVKHGFNMGDALSELIDKQDNLNKVADGARIQRLAESMRTYHTEAADAASSTDAVADAMTRATREGDGWGSSLEKLIPKILDAAEKIGLLRSVLDSEPGFARVSFGDIGKAVDDVAKKAKEAQDKQDQLEKQAATEHESNLKRAGDLEAQAGAERLKGAGNISDALMQEASAYRNGNKDAEQYWEHQVTLITAGNEAAKSGAAEGKRLAEEQASNNRTAEEAARSLAKVYDELNRAAGGSASPSISPK